MPEANGTVCEKQKQFFSFHQSVNFHAVLINSLLVQTI